MTDPRLGQDTASRAAAIRDWLVAKVASRVGIDARRIDLSERFSRYGIDSLKAAGITAELSAFLGQPLPRTLLWDNPSINAVARHLTASPDTDAAVAIAPAGVSAEPIAIVGLACRFPGAPDTEAFWRLLLDGVDAISEVPADRWNIEEMFSADPTAPGKMSTRWGGFLSEIDRFDPQFFGISPREAEHMDPQQRIVLELAWRALEDAGIRPASLKDSSTGVYIGAMWSDYARLIAGTRSAITQHTATGQDTSIIAARVSYTFGLQGPSVAVNTACSSSLVAVHHACQALRTGDATLALAGGVNLVLAPDSTVAMSKFGGMAPDGRSKAFDARANGYVRSEGAGMVVLKPLSRALKDGDTIYCLIRGEGVNNDGFSNGLTAPNPQAQEQMLRIACARAGVQPADVDYVETHGTGTLLGDPIEAGALGRVLGVARPEDRPLRIGSLKTNIGHLEAAAGIAGLIKVALSLRRGLIPGNLHFETPNPHIDFSALRLAVQSTRSPLPARDRAVLAGVSSFGFGGTNCHVVVEQWRGADSVLVPVSADSADGLRETAARLAAAALGEGETADPRAWSRAAWQQVSAGSQRGAVVVRSPRDLAPQLSLLASGQAGPGITLPSAAPTGRRVWVCSPHGGQWTGMGRELLSAEPAFRAAIERCEPLIQREGGWSILDEILADEKASRLGDVAVAQAAIFAIQVGIAAVLRSWGLQPDVVIGHSMGEVAAAHIAGVLSLEDAVKVICHRSRLLAKTAGKGALAVVGLSAEATRTALEGRGDQLWVVAFNSPKSTLVSGEPETLGALLADLERDGVFCRRVRVDVAAHSPHMDPLLPELADVTASVAPSRGTATLVSTVTGGVLAGAAFDSSYWVRNLRQSVLFSQAIDAVLADGPAVFVEIGPHPVLAPAIEQALAASAGGRVIETMRRAEPERDALLDSVARLYAAGHPPRWESFTPRVEAAVLPEGIAANGSCRTDTAAAQPFLLSAHTPRTLVDRARATAAALRAHPEFTLRDVCYTAALRRAPQAQRLSAVADSTAALADLLERFAGGDIAPGVSVGEREVAGPGRTVFVFPGQGAQWLGMGRRLMQDEPAFLQSLERCDAAVRAVAGWSVIDELTASAEASRLDRIDVIQPVLFSVQVALWDLWRAWGVAPDAVVGHSMGEVAAAFASGALSLEDAARLICCRSALMRQTSGRGAMAAVELSLADAALSIRGLEDRVSVAVSNAPRSTVLSGDPETLDLLMSRLTAEGVFCKRVKVDVASHSPQMDVLLDDLRRGIASIAPRASATPFYSTVAGTPLDGADLNVDYWTRNLREPVLFATAVARLCADGYDTFVEMSPHPLLVPAVQESLRAEKRAGTVVGSFVRDDVDERASMLASLGALFAHGHDLPWEHVFGDSGRVVPIGPYMWEKQRCWIDADYLDRRAALEEGGDYLFETEWIEQPLGDARAGRQHSWLVLANPGSACAIAAQRLESTGHRVTVVPAPRRLHAVDRLPTEDEAVGALEDLLLPELSDCDAIVYGWGVDAPGAPAAVDAVSEAVDCATLNALRLVQILDRIGVSPRLYLVTSGAQPAGGADVTAPARAGLWGLGSAIAVEHPEMRCTRIDLDDIAAPAALAAELAAAPDEDQVAFRRDRRLVARLKKGIGAITASDSVSALASLAKANPSAVRAALGPHAGRLDEVIATLGGERRLPEFAAGTCLITGGLTGLGLVTAEWLVEHGARSLALLGRRAPSVEALATIERLRQSGATVTVIQADASRADDMGRAVAEIRATMRPLRGVIHAAGVLDDAVLAKMTPAQYHNVLAPKVRGAWLLHQLTLEEELDYFVMYSSVLAYLGAAGQANHAIANAFLDALAHYRRGLGHPALSVNWGVWSSVGSAAAAGRGDRLGAMGLTAITPAEGCDALGRILTSGAVQGSVMRFSADAWRQNLSGAARSNFLANFVAASRGSAEERPAAAEPALLEQLNAAQPQERRAIVERFVAARAARVLRLNADQIDFEKPLRAMGLDSLLAVEFRNRLEADTGLSIPTTLIWNYPTVAKLAPQVAERLGMALDDAAAAAGAARTDELDELLGALESMSDDAARRALFGGTRVADV